MRQVYRMKKLSQLHLTNWYHVDWTNAPNLVAKCYKSNSDWNPADRMRCFADVKLQIAAAELAVLYNHSSPQPPKQIEVITCFVIEFYDRPGIPVFGCERFIDGRDEFGHGFVKHNSNTGFVDDEEIRQTPQAFSYYSFFASNGERMVVDVQGVNDLYTDPQLHSIDCRFGNADLGAKGMAFFFANSARGPLFEYLCLPEFEMSRRIRIRLQEKGNQRHNSLQRDGGATATREDIITKTASSSSRAGRRRVSAMWHPMAESLQRSVQADVTNIIIDEDDRTEINESLAQALSMAVYELDESAGKSRSVTDTLNGQISAGTGDSLLDLISLSMTTITPSLRKILNRELALNMSKVHFELAALHIQGQFSTDIGEDGDPLPDIPSCVFHLCKACIYGSVEAALALGKIKQGPMDEVTILTMYLQEFINIDAAATHTFSELSARRMRNPNAENGVSEGAETIKPSAPGRHLVRQPSVAESHSEGMCTVADYRIGDEVEANFLRGGFWYAATILNIRSPLEYSPLNDEDNDKFPSGSVTVRYDEGTIEKLDFGDIKKRRVD
jgi:elongation factor 2 kinase